jgi:Cu2+-exporting ATPase
MRDSPKPMHDHDGEQVSHAHAGQASGETHAAAPHATDPHASHDERAGPDKHAGHDKHTGHSVAMFRDKFWISLLLTLPTLVWGHMLQRAFG